MAKIGQPRDPEILKHWIDVITDEASDDLNSWETSFMASIQIYLWQGQLTEPQEDNLESIMVLYVKYTS